MGRVQNLSDLPLYEVVLYSTHQLKLEQDPGSQELLEELFGNCYLYVHPSDVEGLSHSLLQAMSFGCCIVCSDIPENATIVSDYAYTFRRGNSENLREVLGELINHPAKVRSQRGKAKDYVRREFNWDSIVDRLEEVYGGMLSEG